MDTSASGTGGPIVRWYTITPNRILISLLVWTGFLYLSKHFVWFEFNRHKGETVQIAVASLIAVLLAFGLWGLASWLWRLRTNRSAPAFQFSLSTLLLFVSVLGITGGWFGEELKQARKQAAIVNTLRGQGASVNYSGSILDLNLLPNFCSERFGEYFIRDVVSMRMSKPIRLEHLKELTQLRDLFLIGPSFTDAGLEDIEELTQLRGLRFVDTSITDAGLVHLNELSQLRRLFFYDTSTITGAGLEHLKDLKQLRAVCLSGPSFRDTALENLKGLAQLEYLSLDYTSITDAGLVHIKGLTQLHELDLDDTSITDAGLEHLKGLTRLQDLGLSGTSITDAGLVHLKGLTQLRQITLNKTSITDAGISELKKALPNCRISH